MEADHSFQLVEELWRTGLLGKIFQNLPQSHQVIQNRPHALGLAEHLMWTYKYHGHLLELDEVLGQYADDARRSIVKGHCIKPQDNNHCQACSAPSRYWKAGNHHFMIEEVHFIGHDKLGAQMKSKRMSEFKFSGAESKAMSMLVENHMRPHNLLKLDEVSPRAVYRFFRDLDTLAIPSLLIGIADAYATKCSRWWT